MVFLYWYESNIADNTTGMLSDLSNSCIFHLTLDMVVTEQEICHAGNTVIAISFAEKKLNHQLRKATLSNS